MYPHKPANKILFSEVDALALASENLPAIVKPPPEYGTSRQAVDRIYVRLIFLMEERNYDYSDLADYLESGLGIKLTPVTVRKYMNAIKKERRKSKRTVTQPEEVNDPSPVSSVASIPIALPPIEVEAPSIEVEAPSIDPVIAPAIVAATPSETPTKSPLRPGEWSNAELRKHFNKY